MLKAKRALLWAKSNFRASLAKPYSQLLISSDTAGWVLDEEGKELIALANSFCIPAYFSYRTLSFLPQCIHYTSFFSLSDPSVYRSKHRISVDYFHGKPNQDPAFRSVYETMKKNADRIERLRLSYSGMKEFALEAGVPEEKIFRIPIGINPRYFSQQNIESKRLARDWLGIPQSAIVIGSFQKDGQGWGEGMEPKWVKAPDVFLNAIRVLKQKFPEIFVLLTGPSRGYVKAGLDKLKVPYKHELLSSYSEVGKFYQAIDLYIVASREEGGPKAILESMISGVPLVTTKVGQAIDLVKHENNGLMVDVENAEALAIEAERVIQDNELRKKLIANGLIAARQETYEAQMPRWKKYFDGFVERF